MSDVALDNIPEELQILPQWVCWRKEWQKGKLTKVPINPYSGEWASTTAPNTWGTLTDACNAIERYGCDGIGFVFTHDDPYAGVDLDKCRDPERGVLEPWAQEIVDSIQTFTEVSTSGTGVHCILRGHLPGARCRKGQTEMYDHERYFVMTGNCLADFPLTIEERQSELETLYAKVFQADNDRRDIIASKPRPPNTHNLSDAELIDKALNPEAEDPEKFKRLWEGDESGYESRSEADAALCALLAFWTCHDAERIDHLFRQSGLYRDKWERDDYRQDTIAFALNGVANDYNPEHYRSLSSGGKSEKVDQFLERAKQEYLKQREAELIPLSQDKHEPLTADIPLQLQNEDEPPSSSEPPPTHSIISLEYFEDLAQEPGHKALCLPPHFGTMGALNEFICKHWQRGFLVATKTIEQAKRLASALVSLSERMETCQPIGGTLRDRILVFHHEMDSALLQEYNSAPEGMLSRYPIIITTHERVLLEPPSFFLDMIVPADLDQTIRREFAIILDRPDIASITLSAEGNALLAMSTDGAETIEHAISSVQAKLNADNPREQLAAFTLLKQLAKVDSQSADLSPLALARAAYRLKLVIAAQNPQTLLQDQVGATAYVHVGLLKNPRVWIVDGTADLTLRDSKYWEIVKEPDYAYQLVCSCPPIVPEIEMIDRNLKKALESADNDIAQAHQIVQGWMGTVLNFLDSLVELHTKILVVIWKDFKETASLRPSGIAPLVEGNTLEAVENGLLRYFALTIKERYSDKFELSSYGTYYGTYSLPSSGAKSIDAVVFIGKFFLPQSAIENFKRANSSHTDRELHSLSEIVKYVFQSRCQFGEPVTLYFTQDWSKDFIQRFLAYTNAKDLDDVPLSIFTQDELLEQKFRKMGFDKRQIRHLGNVVKLYPEFEDSWQIELPTQKVKEILGKSNIRDIREMLGNWEKKGITITML